MWPSCWWWLAAPAIGRTRPLEAQARRRERPRPAQRARAWRRMRLRLTRPPRWHACWGSNRRLGGQCGIWLGRRCGSAAWPQNRRDAVRPRRRRAAVGEHLSITASVSGSAGPRAARLPEPLRWWRGGGRRRCSRSRIVPGLHLRRGVCHRCGDFVWPRWTHVSAGPRTTPVAFFSRFKDTPSVLSSRRRLSARQRRIRDRVDAAEVERKRVDGNGVSSSTNEGATARHRRRRAAMQRPSLLLRSFSLLLCLSSSTQQARSVAERAQSFDE